MARKKKSAMDAIDFTVSPRDREIWYAVEVQRRKSCVVAGEYKLSKSRITAILKRVGHWMGLLAPKGLDELPREARLRAACRTHLWKLREMEDIARAAFEDSKAGKTTIKRRFVKGELVYEEQTAQAQRPDRKYWADAITAAEKQMAFEGVDVRGQVDVSCAGRVPEAPPTTDVELHREVKMRAIRGDFDTPGDEGVPGAWRAEMEMRNAAVALSSEESSGEGGGVVAGEVAAPVECREPLRGEDASFHGVKGDCGGCGEGGDSGSKVLTDSASQSAQEDKQTVVRCDAEKAKVLTNSPPKFSARRAETSSPTDFREPWWGEDATFLGVKGDSGEPKKIRTLTQEEILERGLPYSKYSDDFEKPRLPGTPKVKKPPA